MFGHRSGTVAPTMKNGFKMQIESNHRIWLKIILSALIPLMIGVFTITTTLLQHKLSAQQRNQDKQESSLLREQSERQADNLQKEKVLVTYFDDVSKLLMLENQPKIFAQLRIKTLTSLRQLDAERKRYLLLFLCESELICQNPPYTNSSLLKIDKSDFNGVQINGTDDNKCSFTRIHLHDVYLSNSSFVDCYIDRSNFSRATMNKAMFSKGLAIRTSFKFTSLGKASFCNMKLATMNFAGAYLRQSDFTGTVWENNTVDFTNTDLTEAKLSDAQLKNSTLDNCILPNGTWGPVQTKNLIPNGDLDQNCSSDDGHTLIGWIVPNGGLIKVYSNKNQSYIQELSKCYFRVVTLNNVSKAEYLAQTINLENFSRLISYNAARYKASITFQCFGKEYVTITLRFIDSNGLRSKDVSQEPTKGTHLQTLYLSDIVRYDVSAVQILVTFINSRSNINPTTEENDCRCYNINFSITKA